MNVRSPLLTMLALVIGCAAGGDGNGCAEGTQYNGGSGGEDGGGGIGGMGGSPTTGGSPATGGEGEGGAPPLVHGVLVITEIMANPDAASDTYAEWFEIYNAANFALPMNGLVLRHDATDPNAVLTLNTAVVLQPGEYFVLGKSLDTAANGGVVVDYLLPVTLSLTNTGDYLAFETEDGTILDHTVWGEAPTGAALNLDPAFTNASTNDDGTHFCPATTPLPSGDLGTPGAANTACP